MTTTTGSRGGAWILRDTDPASVMTPERLGEEHRLVARTAEEFIDREVLAVLDRLEQKDWTLARALVRRCGELGLLGVEVPAALGGEELDKVTSLIVGEAVGRCPSFGTTFGAKTGLAITPLLCFGTAEQQRRYVPRLVTGEAIGAYALSESGSGSDALGARTRAVRDADGSFRLNGEKMWISNGGFADIFIVFAKVYDAPGDDDAGQFTAFIVERAFPGVSTGGEEHKLGLHGSSTTPLVLQDARVPASNVLGEIGKGHKIAFNVLNHGRFKLGAMCSGSARRVIGQAAAYAAERQQFGRPIAGFGAIRQKLADMVALEYAVESMLYRTAGLVDETIGGSPHPDAGLAALEEFAVEASILKVAGSEMIDVLVDENVQIHGGNGFVRDYPAERHFRDARVNRIFEGTNEINRLLIPGILAKRAAKGALPLWPVESPPDAGGTRTDRQTLGDELRTIAAMKRTAVLVLGSAMQKYTAKLGDEQEVLLRAADIVIATYAAESAVLRAIAAGKPLHEAAARLVVHDSAARAGTAAGEALAAMLDGEPLSKALGTLAALADRPPVNTVALRRALAEALLERRVYPF